jgi:hypothetical protein
VLVLDEILRPQRSCITEHDQQTLEVSFGPKMCHQLRSECPEVFIREILHRGKPANQRTESASRNAFQGVHLLPLAVFRLKPLIKMSKRYITAEFKILTAQKCSKILPMYKMTSERKEFPISPRTVLKKPELTIPRISACLVALVIEEAPARTTSSASSSGWVLRHIVRRWTISCALLSNK